MSRSVSRPMMFDVPVGYGAMKEVSVTCTHDRSSDSVIFEYSDGRRHAFSDDEWLAMSRADEDAMSR